MRTSPLANASVVSFTFGFTTAYVLPSSSSMYPQGNSTVINSCEYLRQDLTQPCVSPFILGYPSTHSPADTSQWEQLNVTEYLNQWWQVHEADCSARDIGFAICYQQLIGVEQEQCAHTGPRYGTNHIDSGFCTS